MSKDRHWTAEPFRVVTAGGDRQVAGWVLGDLAIDFRTLLDDDDGSATFGWCVSHIPTGLAIFALAMGMDEVKPIVEELADYADWGPIRPENSVFLKGRVQALMARFPGLVFRSDQTFPPWATYNRRGAKLTVVK